jgi:hypothetical protein
MKVRRFFYVAAPYGTRLHIQFGRSHSEGPVACGRQSQPGWSWWHKRKWVRIPLCKQCEASA